MRPDISSRVTAVHKHRWYPVDILWPGWIFMPTQYSVLIDGKYWRRVWWDREGYFVIFQHQTWKVEGELVPEMSLLIFWCVFIIVAGATALFLYYNLDRRL
jgi:hypothetical protein